MLPSPPRVAACLLAIAAGCASGPRGRDRPEAELARRIEAVLARPELRSSTVGIEVRRLGDGRLLYANGADRLLAPASTTKLVPCAGALAVLGKGFRFETRVVRTGDLTDGVLHGDLVLIASGDPNLSQRPAPGDRLLFENNDHSYAGFVADASLVPGDPLQVLHGIASEVKQAGVERIEGAVVVDDGLFREVDDEFVHAVSAACVNDNLVDVTVRPAQRAGEPPIIETLPARPEVVVDNGARTVERSSRSEADLRLEPRGGPLRFELVGAIPVGSPPVLCAGQIPDPALGAAQLFSGELAREGITVRDPPRRARSGPPAYASAAVICRRLSPPLSEAVKVILKVSQNLHATMLPLVVGALRGGAGDRVAGYRVIHDLFQREGLGVDSVVLSSGSGGGRADALTARFLVELLRHVAGRDSFPELFHALPVGGVDGTLASHFTAPRLKGRVHAKTGTLVYRGTFNSSWIYISKALAGYIVPGEAGGEGALPGPDAAAFAILIQNTQTRSRKDGSDALFRAQEDILEAVRDALEALP